MEVPRKGVGTKMQRRERPKAADLPEARLKVLQALIACSDELLRSMSKKESAEYASLQWNLSCYKKEYRRLIAAAAPRNAKGVKKKTARILIKSRSI
jgi:hypothetical protein